MPDTYIGRRELFETTGFDEFAQITKTWEYLAPYTSFKIGGAAEAMFFPRTEEEFVKLYHRCLELDITPYILGGGCNLLIATPILPVVICTSEMNNFFIENEILTVDAGVSLPVIVQKTFSRGLSGLEGLVGVPGTIGGAVVGNVGGTDKESTIGERVQKVRVIERDGGVSELYRQDLSFKYRNTNLRDRVVLGATLKFNEAPVEELKERFKQLLRRKTEVQPLSAKSAGCIFKNPPGYCAWRLISEAGLVGYRIGSASVSEKHANFIVNLGGASGDEVLELIEFIREKVYKSTGIELELEVKVW